MITITNNYFQDLNAAIAAELFLKNAKPKKKDLYAAIDQHNQQFEAVSEDSPAELPEDEAALQARLLAMDAVEDAAKAAAVAQAKAAKKSRKLSAGEQAQKNAADLAKYQRIVTLKEAIGAKKTAEQLTAEGQKMGGTTVCQIATTYNKVLMASSLIQELFNAGLVTWGELYSRSRRIDIAAIEAELSARLPQAC